MLERFVLPIDYGVSYGSVTLKSLQNDNVPDFLEIRDLKTSGLTGCIRKADIKKEDHGNFFKLIYDTGKRQTQAGAGGNWGFGKSVYYRVGIGIVIFYSRIKNETGYESRLIVTLVEDESKKNPDGSDATILNRLDPNSAGKAWWGIRDGEDLLPISDDEFIVPLLDTFGLKPFTGEETGTSVIIPYIDPSKLLEDIIPADAEIESGIRDHFETNWTSTLADYLKLAIQRWYAPKIHNRSLPEFCDKKWLYASVNNIPIRRKDMLPFFQLVQELYTAAIAKTYGSEYRSEWLPQIQCLAVNIQRYFEGGSTSGFVAAIKISRDELNGTQNVLSPYVYIGKFEAERGKNEPIVMYARDPGMVIDYSVTGPWVKGISLPESEDEFIFAFYMPTTTKILKNDLPAPEFAGMNLGEYLRACEASDHMGWDDPAKMQIVTRIQKNTVTQIENKIVKNNEPKFEATASKLAATLGRSLLPRVGYGKKKNGSGGSGSGGGSGNLKNIEFEIFPTLISSNEIEIPFRLKLSHGKKTADLELIVASEGGWITPSSWQSDIGTLFPATIESFTVHTVTSNIDAQPIELNDGCSSKNLLFDTEKLSAELLHAEGSHELSSVKVTAHILNMELYGLLKIRAYDKKYRFSIRVE